MPSIKKPTLCTLEGAKALADKTFDEAFKCLDIFGNKAEPLRELTLMVQKREA